MADMRRLRRIVEALSRRVAPPKPYAVLILPDDGSGDDLDPQWLGDGVPSWPVHLVRDNGVCRQCGQRHFDEPSPSRQES